MKGIRRTPTSWQVYARVDRKFLSKRFPLDTKIEDLKAARNALQRGDDLDDSDTRTFQQDADDYLKLVTDMPSIGERTHHIKQWATVFGSKPRTKIAARDIRLTLETWRKTGAIDGGKLSPGSLNRRRTALMHLYTTLDGKSQPNIVKDVPAYSEHYSEQARSRPMLDCACILRRTRLHRKSRARLRVLMWTGWPHALLKGITAEDVDWTHARVNLGRRKKGRGMPPAWIPVVPRALAALRYFAKMQAWGTFSNSTVHRDFTEALAIENARREKAKLPPVSPMRVYDLKHSFGTWAARIIKDDRALKELLRTQSIARYTQAALASRLDSARDSLSPKRVVATLATPKGTFASRNGIGRKRAKTKR